jgi:quinol monooxygenase YgiN
MSKLTIVARLVVKKEAMESVKIELLNLIGPTKNENGSIDYNVHQDNDDPNVFVFYETWENAAAFEKHKNSDHYKSYATAVEGKIADKLVHKMTRIG